MSEKLDLTALFQAVSTTMVDNQETLNQADMNDQDHGDNMVEVFQVITEAMQSQPNADPADQLAYASQLLRQREQNGSAQIYAPIPILFLPFPALSTEIYENSYYVLST